VKNVFESSEECQTYGVALSLIDTSHPTQDIFVEKQLVDANRAAKLVI